MTRAAFLKTLPILDRCCTCIFEGFSSVVEPLRYLTSATWLLTPGIEISDALSDTTVPCVLVACKCDQLPEDGELGPIHERHDIYRTSPESPRSQQMCIALVLRSVVGIRAGESQYYSEHQPQSPPSRELSVG